MKWLDGRCAAKKAAQEAAERAAKEITEEAAERAAKEGIEEGTEQIVNMGDKFIPTQEQMHDAVTQWARMEECLANSNRQLNKFNTATVVYDAATGKFYYGMNRGVQLSGDSLDEVLATWLPKESLNHLKVGNRAEVDAINQALKDNANVKDLYLYTINTKTNEPQIMCDNCIFAFMSRVADVLSN